MSDAQQTNVVDVYVRLSDDDRSDMREISFKIPAKLSQKDMLEAGFSIDGHSAARAVMAYTDDVADQYVPLQDALRDAQLELIGWLGQRGYAVNFK